MHTLASQQQALVDALFAWPSHEAASRLATHATSLGSQPQRGLQAYQANGHMLAERALQSAYPVVEQLLGSQSFAELARALWHAHPPHCGDVARWGAQLPDFLRNSPQLQEDPYLGDVARVEWLLHCASMAADAPPDLPSLALLTSEDADGLALVLAPGLGLMASRWPVADLWTAHTQGQPSLAQVGEQLRAGVAQTAIVWRQGLQPRLRPALPGEYALLHAMQCGMALALAVDQATDLDFAQWLTLAVQTGLVLGAALT